MAPLSVITIETEPLHEVSNMEDLRDLLSRVIKDHSTSGRVLRVA
jgi:hypothetical protein